jgi:type IX secretion system PorP/SprF family membrane protein
MRKVFLSLLLLGFSAMYAQEDVQLIQLYSNRLFVNPAGINGMDELFRVSLTDNEQYWGKDFAGIRSSSRFLNVTQFFQKQHSGIGLTVYHQNQNVLNTVLIKASYAYHLQVGKEAFISLGASAGYIDGFIDHSVSYSGDYISNNELNPEFEKPNLDVGVGIEFYTNEVVAGVSVAHLPIRIQQDATVFDMHSYYYFGYNHKINEYWRLFPMISLRLSNRSTNLDVSLRAFYREWVYFGASYRRDAVSIMAGVNIGQRFSIGYAIDLNIGSMNKMAAAAGKHLRPSHEFILTYRGCIFCSGEDNSLIPVEY